MEEQKEKRTRRPNLTAEEIEAMKAQEAAGKTRKQISDAFNVPPSVVTRKLGAVRPYRGARAKA